MMSAQNRDRLNRLRSKTVAFRLSPEEADQLDKMVALSGLTKQDYIVSHLQEHRIAVVGNPRVYKALRGQMDAIYQELHRLEVIKTEHAELLELTAFTADIYERMVNKV